MAIRWEAHAGDPATGRVWINPRNTSTTPPRAAWEFPIGGYQPAQKWLKDRKGRTLSTEGLMHWQRIIVALAETGRMMENLKDRIG